jgi:hypothetical protein
MKFACCLLLAGCAALTAQQFQINLDHLAVRSSNSVEISLSGSTLQLAARFLGSKDPDEARVKKLILGLEGIYVRTFSFKAPGEWSSADLDSIRKQLRSPQWSRVVGVKGGEGGTEEIYVRNGETKLTGVAILIAEAKSLTVVNIAGPVDLDSLADLGGHLGIPKLDLHRK